MENYDVKNDQKRILIVDDDKDVLQLVDCVLSQHYNTSTAPSAIQALQLYNEKGADLIITDVMMPRMNGAELYHAVLAINPAQKFLFMSGHVEDSVKARLPDLSARLLAKPFANIRDVSDKVRELLEGA